MEVQGQADPIIVETEWEQHVASSAFGAGFLHATSK